MQIEEIREPQTAVLADLVPVKPETPYEEFNEEFGILYDMLPEHIEHKKHVLAAVKRGIDAKRGLALALGLGPDYRMRLQVPASGDQIAENHLANNVAWFIYDWNMIPKITCLADAFNAIATGEVRIDDKQKMKLTRFIMKHHLESTEAFGDSTRGQQLKTKWAEIAGRLNFNSSFEVCLAQVLSDVSGLKTDVVISANPLDILLASECSTFTSCYTFNNCHANGAISYAVDSFTAIIFLDCSEEKVYPFRKRGRAFLYAPEGLTRFVIGKPYGALSHPQITTISDKISTRLAEFLQLENKWKAAGRENSSSSSTLYYPGELLENAGGRSVHRNHEKFAVYFDAEISRYVAHKSLITEGVSLESTRPYLKFSPSVCYKCGVDTTYNRNLTCEDCDPMPTCPTCGYECDEDELIRVNGEEYCSECIYEHADYCNSCDEYVHHGTTTDVSGDSICESCFDEYYFMCSHCDESASNDYANNTVDGEVCHHCFQHHYSKCTGCKEATNRDDMTSIDDHLYCNDCHSDCEVCSKETPEDDLAGMIDEQDNEIVACSSCRENAGHGSAG